MGRDLSGALPHLVNSDADALARGGGPSTPRWVHDDHFETAQQALEAAHRQGPSADPDKWKTPDDFRESFKDELDAQLVPEAQAPEPFDQVVAGAAALVAFLVAGLAAVVVLSWLGVSDSSDDDSDIGLMVCGLFLSLSAAGAVYRFITGLFGRRNLARAMKQ